MLKLKDFQHEGVKFLLTKRRTILADDMGLGKTAQAISACAWIPVAPGKRRLIIAPKTLGRVWANEIKKWQPKASCEILKGDQVSKMLKLKISKADYFIGTYESLSSLLPVLMEMDFDVFIFDEAHKFKSRDSKMHKAVSKLMRRFPTSYMFALTGTPIMNRTDELWSLLHAIDPIQYSNFHAWASIHLTSDQTYVPNAGWVKSNFRPRNPELFKDYVSQYMLRRLKKDCLELPEKTHVTYDVELEGEQLEMYQSMSDSYFIQWQDEEKQGKQLSATVIIAAITRMKQIALSVDLLKDADDPNKVMKPLRGAKIEALEELLEEAAQNGQKVVVFSQFASAIRRLYNQFSTQYKCEKMTGDESGDARDKAVTRFQEGDSEVFFIGTQVGGVGITLTAATIAIFLDLMWTPASNAQAADRLHRMGQFNPVTIYYIRAVDTVEEYILSVLAQKESTFMDSIPEAEFNKMDVSIQTDWRKVLRG